MSVLSRVSAPAATHDLAGVVVALLSNPERTAPRNLHAFVRDQQPGDEGQLTGSVSRFVAGPTGLGTSAARIPWPCTNVGMAVAAANRGTQPHLPDGPTGVGTSTVQVSAERPADDGLDSELYCPPALRDDKALGEEVNDRPVSYTHLTLPTTPYV